MPAELSKSPERNTFQRNKYFERMKEKGLDAANSEEVRKRIEMYNMIDEQISIKENDRDWKKNNLEYDLRTTDWILQKVRDSEVYAQNLYAAMCNRDFMKNEIFPILKEETWSCSWRHSGGIIADMRVQGDYMDWYCSGNGGMFGGSDVDGFVNESVVTEEIREDLLKLGWRVLDEPE